MFQQPLEKRPTTSAGLVNGEQCLNALFPDPKSRPSLRWFLTLKTRGLIPFRRIRGLVFYDVEEVRRAIDTQFTVRANN